MPRGDSATECCEKGGQERVAANDEQFQHAPPHRRAVGNIRGYTRTMTTTIALETSRGDLPLALGLGLILILLSITVSAAAFLLAGLAGQPEHYASKC
jgi:hypothetical protein